MEPETYLRFLLALVFVLALIGLVAWLARRFGLGGAVPVQRGRRRRLIMIEALAVDGKRRLVLVRRDDIEHLILLGTGSDIVVETGITPLPDSFIDRPMAADAPRWPLGRPRISNAGGGVGDRTTSPSRPSETAGTTTAEEPRS